MNEREPSRLVPHGVFKLDFKQRAVILPNGKSVELTPLELRVFLQLDPEIPISAAELAEKVNSVQEAIGEAWKERQKDEVRAGRQPKERKESKVTAGHMIVQIYSLRKKLGQDSILSRKWSGYTLGFPQKSAY